MSSIPLDAAAIAPLSHVTAGSGLKVQLGQTEHRINLVRQWDIKPGESVLELGCGQGDCTTVLAAAVGTSGHVTAVDPAPLDYGSPFTLGQAQSFISAGSLGPIITFVRDDPVAFLGKTEETWDVAVLAACTWYFPSPEAVRTTLRALSGRAKRICISEFALSASNPAAFPNVLAVLTQAALECRKTESTSNVRTLLSPKAVKEIIVQAGLEVVDEAVVETPKGMYDGRWEVGAVLSESFLEEIKAHVEDEKERSVVLALRDSVEASKKNLPEGTQIRTMDVWVATLKASGH